MSVLVLLLCFLVIVETLVTYFPRSRRWIRFCAGGGFLVLLARSIWPFDLETLRSVVYWHLNQESSASLSQMTKDGLLFATGGFVNVYRLVASGLRILLHHLWARPYAHICRLVQVLEEIGVVVVKIRGLLVRLGMTKTLEIVDWIVTGIILTLLFALVGVMAMVQWYFMYLRWLLPRLFPKSPHQV